MLPHHYKQNPQKTYKLVGAEIDRNEEIMRRNDRIGLCSKQQSCQRLWEEGVKHCNIVRKLHGNANMGSCIKGQGEKRASLDDPNKSG